MKNRLTFLLAVALAAIMAGCGGGGGGGTTPTPTGPAPATIHGTVDSASGTPAVGFTVRLGTGGSLSTTTDSTGSFSISFDAANLSGSQPLYIYNTNGTLFDKETVNISRAGGTIDLGVINLGPPPPPV